MKARRGLALLCAVGAILFALLLPAAVMAEPPQQIEVQNRGLRLELSIDGSRGYFGFIITRGHKQVVLLLIKGRAFYGASTSSGRVNRHGIQARFGELGEVSVRFEGKRAPWEGGILSRGARKRECRGRKPVFEAGDFHGTIQFRGENSFTRIDATSVPGSVARHYRRVCKVEADGSKPDPSFGSIFGHAKMTQLNAVAHTDGAEVTFEASDLTSLFGFDRGPAIHSFAANTVEHRDGIEIVRGFSLTDSGRSFQASGEKSERDSAFVDPPQPFAGSASYLKEKGAPASWTGPLTVHLPGSGPVALAGPDFKAKLCHIRFEAAVDGGCEPGRDRIAPAPAFRLRSGQRLPVPGLLGSQALLVEIAAKLR
jgi:hypothetical protein